MSFESASSHINEQPKLWTSTEEVSQAKSNAELTQHITDVNNVLQVLDFPDNQEEFSRNILKKQGKETLKELAKSSKEEILSFLYKEKMKETQKIEIEESQKQHLETKTHQQQELDISNTNERLDQKITSIKSAFPTDILAKNPDIAEKINNIDQEQVPQEKEKIFNEILNVLKEDGRLKAITDDLWWANKSNPRYVEFRNSLIGLDSSFEGYFSNLENINSWVSFDTNEIINNIETNSGGIIDFDIGADEIISKMSLIGGSEYSFDKKIDKQVLSEVMGDNMDKIEKVQWFNKGCQSNLMKTWL